MMLDPYHAQIGEGNLIELLRRADSFIGEVQVADVPGRCEPGTGEINYSAIVVAPMEMGYRGAGGVEAYGSGGDDVALECVHPPPVPLSVRPPAAAPARKAASATSEP